MRYIPTLYIHGHETLAAYHLPAGHQAVIRGIACLSRILALIVPIRGRWGLIMPPLSQQSLTSGHAKQSADRPRYKSSEISELELALCALRRSSPLGARAKRSHAWRLPSIIISLSIHR